MESGHLIAISAETLFNFGPLPVTNTLLVSWLVCLILIIFSFLATRKMVLVPGGLQNFFEAIVEFGYRTTEDIASPRGEAGHDKSKFIFPLVMTFFLFIIVANWLGLFPGFGTIGIEENQNGKHVFTPLLRSINSDLNMTLSLALVSAVATHYFAIKTLGVKYYLSKWFSLSPIFLFVGLLELVGEFTKVVSLSFRLFGNIFAGEVVLTTVSTLFKWTAFLVPLPFYFLEIIVGFVQAAVFMMLTLVFMVILSEKHGSEEH